MEWKLERSAARKVQTDEEVLWVKIMKALGTDLREIRQRHLQMRTKTPGKISYSHFESCIVKKPSDQFPVASSPISTRWQQVYARNQAEQTFAECPPMELSTSNDGSDLTGTVEKITTLPVSSDILLEAPSNALITFTNTTKLCENSKTQKQKWLHQRLVTGGNGHCCSEKGSSKICEKQACLWKGCEDGCKVECDAQGISAHASGFPHLETQIRFHITGLCNDYSCLIVAVSIKEREEKRTMDTILSSLVLEDLNLLDWSKENLIALALGSAVHIWKGKEPQHVESMSVCPSSKYIASVAWMKENAHLAFGTSDGEMQLWDIETQKRLQNMFGHMSVVGALSWNGYMLSSGSRLGYIYHHDVRTAQHHTGMVRQSKQSVCSLQWSPNNKLLACGSSDGLLNIWSNDQIIATGGGMKDRSLHIWNIISMNDLKTANSESRICFLLWLPNTKEIVTGQDHPGNKINIWKYPMLSNSAEFYGLPVPLRPGLECLYLVLGERDRLGILLVYRAPFCPAVSLSELTETVSDLVLRTPRMLVLGDFNLHAESGLTGAAQDFMASMTAMGLSQHVIGPTHERGHTLDLVFTTGQVEDDLRVKNLCLTPLSWSDHLLVRFVLESGLSLYKSADPIVWACPRSQMDPDGFLKALGEFPADKTGAPVEALVELWNGEMTRAVDTIAPKRPLPPGRVRSSPWYTPELRAMKRVGRQLERRWRKSQDESDRTHLRAHYRAYAVAVKAAKKKFFSASIASSQCRPAELF
ncbi:hypothetical protein EYD10_03722 [Varanus komodoensis]|nr:hypothetical protein EYD10_03722 [Varanus komodoensis]